MIRSTRDQFFLKKISKLDFLKTVSVTIIAENENKKISSPYDLYIFSVFPLLVFPTNFFKNCSPYPIFWIFHFPLQKMGGTGRGWRTICIHLKLFLYDNI